MPYNSQCNINVVQVACSNFQKHMSRENTIEVFSTNYEIPSMLEASVLEVHSDSGSGFGAATVQDLGIGPTWRAASGEGKAERVRQKVIEVGEGLSAAGVSAGGVSAGSQPKRASKKKGEGVSGGALLTLKDVGATQGQG